MTCKRHSSISCGRPSWNLFSYLLYHILSLLPCQLLLKGTFATRAIYPPTAKALFPIPPGLPFPTASPTSLSHPSTLLSPSLPSVPFFVPSIPSPPAAKQPPWSQLWIWGVLLAPPTGSGAKPHTSIDFVVFLEGKVHLASGVARIWTGPRSEALKAPRSRCWRRRDIGRGISCAAN